MPSTPFGWNGRWGAYLDTETGLLCLGARYYAPALGRFLSRDPSGFPGGPNLYAYALCDPADFFDVDGMEADPTEDSYWFSWLTNHVLRPASRYEEMAS